MNHETTPPYLRDQFTTCDPIDYFLSFKRIPNLMNYRVEKGENKPSFQAPNESTQAQNGGAFGRTPGLALSAISKGSFGPLKVRNTEGSNWNLWGPTMTCDSKIIRAIRIMHVKNNIKTFKKGLTVWYLFWNNYLLNVQDNNNLFLLYCRCRIKHGLDWSSKFKQWK